MLSHLGYQTDLNDDSYAGEAAFNRLSMEERSKFREETLVNVGDVRRRSQKVPMEERFSSEYIVVRGELHISFCSENEEC